MGSSTNSTTQQFYHSSKPMKGGARKGAGRKAGRKTAVAFFSLRLETIAALAAIPAGQRSKFVQAAIVAALGTDAK